MTLLNPLDALIPRSPFSFSAEFRVRISLGRTLGGACQLSPLFLGGGPSQRLSTPAPYTKLKPLGDVPSRGLEGLHGGPQHDHLPPPPPAPMQASLFNIVLSPPPPPAHTHAWCTQDQDCSWPWQPTADDALAISEHGLRGNCRASGGERRVI